MLEDLRQYNNLGTAVYFWEVLNLFYSQPDTEWTQEGLDAHFRGKILDGRDIFDGGLPLLVKSGILEIDIAGIYHTSYGFNQRLYSRDHCRGRVLDALLGALKEDDGIYSIFSTEFCSYDIINNAIQISKSAFGLQYANIRDLLISLGFLVPHPNFPAHSYIVSKSNRKLFDRHLTDGIRKRQLSPEQLKTLQARQQENGLLGEAFVLDYERTRTGRGHEVEWVAAYDSAAGFDIMSFESSDSTDHDRLIEVKAFSGQVPYFFWSRNEMDVAQNKPMQYFLYLVNLDKIGNADYKPTIILDPVNNILDNEKWIKTIEKYHITLSNI